jgi:hypothetical protein
MFSESFSDRHRPHYLRRAQRLGNANRARSCSPAARFLPKRSHKRFGKGFLDGFSPPETVERPRTWTDIPMRPQNRETRRGASRIVRQFWHYPTTWETTPEQGWESTRTRRSDRASTMRHWLQSPVESWGTSQTRRCMQFLVNKT